MNKSRKDVPRGAGRVAFWARKESIEKMLEAKHTLMATFLAHKKELNIEYGQFRRYVNKYIKDKQNGDTDRATETEKGVTRKATTPVRTRTPDQPAFVSSPTPRDNLIHPKSKE